MKSSQSLLLGPKLFIMSVNYLNLSVASFKVNHFLDDANLLLINKLPKKINSLINHKLTPLEQTRKLKYYQNRNYFQTKTQDNYKVFQIHNKWGNNKPSSTVKYPGVLVQDHLEWQGYIHYLLLRLNKAASLKYGTTSQIFILVLHWFSKQDCNYTSVSY